MRKNRFENKIVLVTGGAKGIGSAISDAFAAEGANVMLLNRDKEAGAKKAAELVARGASAESFTIDVADRKSVDHAYRTILEKWKGIDILVNNAAGPSPSHLTKLTTEEWDFAMGVNLRGCFNCTQAAIEGMKFRAGANIVNISSSAGRRISYYQGAAYTTAKTGILGFTKHCAYELAGFGIRVNAVSPGFIETSGLKNVSGGDEAKVLESKKKITSILPLGQMGKPEDVAAAVLFLSSDEARVITGANIDVDSGYSVSPGGTYYSDMMVRGVDFKK